MTQHEQEFEQVWTHFKRSLTLFLSLNSILL